MSQQDNQERREECRREVRRHLYERASVAQSVGAIRRGLAADFDFTEAEVRAALLLLKDLGQVKAEPASLGATLYFQITATGTLEHERA